MNLTTLLERSVRGVRRSLLKCSKSKKTLFAMALICLDTRETDFFAQRVICTWNKLPAEVKCSESATSFKSRIDSFRIKGYKEIFIFFNLQFLNY